MLSLLYNRSVSLTSSSFLSKEELKHSVSRLFEHHLFCETVINKRYNHVIDLLKSIKYTGVQSNHRLHNGLWTSKSVEQLQRLFDYYYGGVFVSYSIVYVKILV